MLHDLNRRFVKIEIIYSNVSRTGTFRNIPTLRFTIQFLWLWTQKSWRDRDVSIQSDSKLQNNPTPDLSKRISTVITTEESLLSLSSLAILYKTNIPISFRAVIWSVCQDWLFYSLSKPRSPLSTSPHSSWSTVLLSLFCWSCACFCKVVTGEGT